jgi:hypothetical protein
MPSRPSREVNAPLSGVSGSRQMLIGTFWIIALCCLHGVGTLFPENFTWGYHGYGFLPFPAALLALALTAMCLVWPRTDSAGHFLDRFAGFMTTDPRRFLAVAAAILAIVAWFARVRVPLLGDGFFIVKNFSDALRGTNPLLYRNEPLATG